MIHSRQRHSLEKKTFISMRQLWLTKTSISQLVRIGWGSLCQQNNIRLEDITRHNTVTGSCKWSQLLEKHWEKMCIKFSAKKPNSFDFFPTKGGRVTACPTPVTLILKIKQKSTMWHSTELQDSLQPHITVCFLWLPLISNDYATNQLLIRRLAT